MNSRMFCATLVCGFTFAANFGSYANSQTPREVFRQNSFALKKFGDSERAHAIYFIGMGLGELRFINSHPGELSEELENRRVLLEGVLAEHLRYKRMKPGDPNYDNDKYIELRTRTDFIEPVFAAIGAERAVELTAISVGHRMIANAERERRNSFEPVSILNNKLLHDMLELSEVQTGSLKRLKKDTTDKLRVGSDELFEEMQSLISGQWKNLLDQLSGQQREAASKLLGKPIEWFRYANEGEHRFMSRDFNLGGQTLVSSKTAAIKAEDGRSVYQMTPEELEAQGIEYVYSNIIEMLEERFIWNELEFTDEQIDAAKNLKLKNVVATGSRHYERMIQLISEPDSVAYPKFLVEILTPHQMTLFQQMELQIFVGKNFPSLGLLHLEISSNLKLTGQQQSTIESKSREFVQQYKRLMTAINEERGRIKSEYQNEALKVLTDEQRATLAKLTKRR